MPQATDETRALMEKWFGSIDYGAPLEFLRSHGYLDIGGWLEKPTESHNISEDEAACIAFLCDEWDFAFE